MYNLSKVYKKSKNIIEQEIEEEAIIIPINSDVVDLENNSVFSLNDASKDIWQRIDGRRKVSDIVEELEGIYDIDKQRITDDIIGLLEGLIQKGLILEKEVEE